MPPPNAFGAPPYGAPGPYAPAAPAPTTNGMSVASLVLGIVWLFGLGSILAVIFGFVGQRQIRESGGRQSGGGMATAGIVLGFVGIAGFILWIVVVVAISDNLSNLDNCLNQVQHNPNGPCGNITGVTGNTGGVGSTGSTGLGTAGNSGTISGSTLFLGPSAFVGFSAGRVLVSA